jgi:hypothetical protein
MLGVHAPRWESGVLCERQAFSEPRFDELQLSDRPLDRLRIVSALESGQIQFEEVSRQYTLHRGEYLHLDVSEGEIRRIQKDPDGDTLQIDLHARVKSLQVGSAERPRDIQPTCLEWIRAQQGPTFAWVTFIGIVGVFNGILRWFKRGDG